MPWEQSAHPHTQTSSWTTSKENSYIHLSRHFHVCTSGFQTIYFLYGQSVKHLENLLNELNTKQPSIKFEYEISKERISFLDTEIYIKNNKLHTKISREKTNNKPFLTSTQSIQNR